MILFYPWLVLCSLFFSALTMLLAPVLALFAGPDGNLPPWLRWFQTFDATLDEGWRSGYFQPASSPAPIGLALYWMRVRWLWRNPGYGFDYYAAGIEFDPLAWKVASYKIAADGTGNMHFFAVGPNLTFNYTGKQGPWRWKFGWKAWNYFDQDTRTFKTMPFGPEMRAPVTFSLLYSHA